MTDPWVTLKLLADSTRLRLINLLTREELSVAELQEVLDMGQSRISSHLAILRQAEAVVDRKDGKRTYYSLSDALRGHVKNLIKAAIQAVDECDEVLADRENLKRIIEKRRKRAESYFNEVAGRAGKNYCPGRSWEAIGHFLLQLAPRIEVADLGAGEGVLALLLARRARYVYCIDNSARMVEVGSELAKTHGFENLCYKLGDIESVPLNDSSVDLALLSQALHHARHPQRAVDEAHRILRTGGQIVVIDLKEHQFEKARELYADTWLGFSENTIHQFLNRSGFQKIEVNAVTQEKEPPHFVTIVASALK